MQDRYPGLIFYGAFVLAAAVMLIYYMRREKPVRSAVLGMVSGAAALLAVHYLEFLPTVPLNGFTAFVALVLGIPGVIFMALITLIL